MIIDNCHLSNKTAEYLLFPGSPMWVFAVFPVFYDYKWNIFEMWSVARTKQVTLSCSRFPLFADVLSTEWIINNRLINNKNDVKMNVTSFIRVKLWRTFLWLLVHYFYFSILLDMINVTCNMALQSRIK